MYVYYNEGIGVESMNKVIIFGAGNGGLNLSRNLFGIEVVAFSDNDSSRWGGVH